MADSTNNGPPQEGLDPKLKILAGLAPAAAVAASDVAIDASVIIPPAASIAPTAMDATRSVVHIEHPPQVGQDPKLLACMNDGGIYGNDITDVFTNMTNGADAYATPDLMPDQNDGGQVAANTEDHDTNIGTPSITAPSSPTKATVAAAMLFIHQNVSNTENSNEQGYSEQQPAKDTPSKNAKGNAQQANSNPNLTSSESLAEWNRIHTNSGPNYNFFEKSQQGNTKNAASSSAIDGHEDAAKDGASPKIEDLIESSKARSAVASFADGGAAASSGMEPLFTLNSEGTATMAPLLHSYTTINASPSENAPQNPATNSTNPSSVAAPSDDAALPPSTAEANNSNFWLQEEEERFLLGLRLYGWGQWKRIQTIVQTRTNKQIKSHAQKREKVNPQIKYTYGKGKSRRGRISSKVLADDARAMAIAGGSVGEVAHAILNNDETIPSLDQAWKDVYGTNNGDGPNSRHRRYRAPHRFMDGSAAPALGSEDSSQQQLALLELGKRQPQPPLRPLQDSLSNPSYKQPVAASLHYYNQHMEDSRAATGDSSAQSPNSQTARTDVNQSSQPPQNIVPASRYSSTAFPLSGTTLLPTLPAIPADINYATATTINNNEPIQLKHTDTTSLRPGMCIYSCTVGNKWSPGTIYSAKIDPSKLSQSHPETHQKESLPLTFHVQYDNGNEDPNVPEEYVMSKQFYEETIHELERRHALPRPVGFMSQYPHPLDAGTPVYCKWDNMFVPEMHGLWLPGTIHSYQHVERTGHNPSHNDSSPVYLYHILFDNEEEKRDVPQQNVLDRTEYHDLTRLKYQNNPHEEETRPIGKLYNLFLRKGYNHHDGPNHSNGHSPLPGDLEGEHQHQQLGGVSHGDIVDGNGQAAGQLDLLFAASQMRTHGAGPSEQEDKTRKRESASTDMYDGAYKRQAVEQIKQQMAEQTAHV